MRVRDLLPWRLHFFNETLAADDVRAAIACARTGHLQDGPHIGRFEEQFTQWVAPDGFAFSFSAGRMALYAVLEAMEIGTGDEVIVPAFTCEAVVRSLIYRGVRPVYADIEYSTFGIDPAHVTSLVTSRTKAVIAQHSFGIPCRLEQIVDTARKHGLRVIEDCALSLGSRHRGRFLGSFSDAAIFSTDRTKPISTMGGGIAFTRDRDLASRVKAIQERSPFYPVARIANVGMQLPLARVLHSPLLYGVGRSVMAVGYKTGALADLYPERGLTLPRYYPARLSNLQAAVGLAQLSRFDEQQQRRAMMVARYIAALEERNVRVPASWRQARLRLPLLLANRSAFVARWRKRLEVGTWFHAPALGWRGDPASIHYREGSCPAAEFAHAHVVNLPTLCDRAYFKDFLLDVASSLRPEDVVSVDD